MKNKKTFSIVFVGEAVVLCNAKKLLIRSVRAENGTLKSPRHFTVDHFLKSKPLIRTLVYRDKKRKNPKHRRVSDLSGLAPRHLGEFVEFGSFKMGVSFGNVYSCADRRISQRSRHGGSVCKFASPSSRLSGHSRDCTGCRSALPSLRRNRTRPR